MYTYEEKYRPTFIFNKLKPDIDNSFRRVFFMEDSLYQLHLNLKRMLFNTSTITCMPYIRCVMRQLR